MSVKFICLSLVVVLSATTLAQGISISESGENADPSAGLDVNFTDKGFLPPRLTTTQRNAIVSPATGLTIFNTTSNCLEWFDGIGWWNGCTGVTYVANVCNPSNMTVVKDVTNAFTGKTWMDRNLGANRAALSPTDVEAYGHLFQWGRGSDGHQCLHRYSGDGVVTSGVTAMNATVNTDTPSHGDFIITNTSPYDWRSPQNNLLWNGPYGVNNPCPKGYRVPTEIELNEERASWSQLPNNSENNGVTAFNSPVKLPLAGSRYFNTGAVEEVGLYGVYWSSTISGTNARYLVFTGPSAILFSNYRGYGLSLRCIKF